MDLPLHNRQANNEAQINNYVPYGHCNDQEINTDRSFPKPQLPADLKFFFHDCSL
jgi:hypothetical protein